MSYEQAFYPQGPTVFANYSSVSTGGVSPSTAGSAYQALRIVNISTGPNAILRFSQAGTDVPVLPLSSLASTAAFGFVLGQNQAETFSCAPNTFVSAISTAATMAGIIAITAGYGKK